MTLALAAVLTAHQLADRHGHRWARAPVSALHALDEAGDGTVDVADLLRLARLTEAESAARHIEPDERSADVKRHLMAARYNERGELDLLAGPAPGHRDTWREGADECIRATWRRGVGGIYAPTVDEEGHVVHQTHTGRLRWRVDPEGGVVLNVDRPGRDVEGRPDSARPETVLAARATPYNPIFGRAATVEALRRYHRRHALALAEALFALLDASDLLDAMARVWLEAEPDAAQELTL